MADEGPTRVGTIVGRLTLDASDWNRKLDEARAKAEALNGVDPRVKVQADTAAANTKLDTTS